MKRTFPQKVKPVPSCETNIGMNIDQSKMLTESSCLTRTSAAVIGLAVSMGAQGILFPQFSEAATADAVSTESVTATLPSASALSGSPIDESRSFNSVAFQSSAAIIDHTVQEGQTLSRIAQLYRLTTAEVLSANGLKPETVLRVGQILKIPVGARIAQLIESSGEINDSPVYYGLVQKSPSLTAESKESEYSDDSQDVNSVLKTKQDAALSKLQQKRDNLRLSLGQLSASDTVVETTAVAPQVIASSTTIPNSEVSSGEKSVKANVTAVLTPGISSPAAPSSLTHRVDVGETLNSIARSYGIPIKNLIEANRISDPNSIFVDQVLTIPQSQVFSSAPTLSQPVLGASKFGVAPALQPKVTLDQVAAAPSFQPGAPLPESRGETSSLTVPTVPAASAASTVAPPTRSSHDYVEGLRAEIIQLRERYKAASSSVTQFETNTSSTARNPESVTSTRSEAVRNPEFVPDGYSESLRAQVRRLNLSASSAKSSEQASGLESATKSTVVAVAPAGSQSYDPLIGKTIGRMVSPELPPIGSGEVYLPSSSGKFAGYIWPAKGLMTSPYGPRWGRMHRGIDVAAPTGTPIVAAAPGIVITAGWNSGGYGNLVEVRHPDGSITLYGHNDRILVKEGQQVAQGQQIAEMGSTGYSTGPHCHFEIHMPGKGAVNPMAYLPQQGA